MKVLRQNVEQENVRLCWNNCQIRNIIFIIWIASGGLAPILNFTLFLRI